MSFLVYIQVILFCLPRRMKICNLLPQVKGIYEFLTTQMLLGALNLNITAHQVV